MLFAGVLFQTNQQGFGNEEGEQSTSPAPKEGAKQPSSISPNTIMSETLTNIRTVIIFNQTAARVQQFNERLLTAQRASGFRALFAGFSFGLSQLFIYGTFALTFWYGGKLLADPGSNADFNSVTIAAMTILMAAIGAGEAATYGGKISVASGAARRVFGIIDRFHVESPASPSINGRSAGFESIALFDAQFVYPTRPDVPVLRSVSIELHPGKHYGFVGKSGGGKSTIVQLLSGFYRPSAGEIFVHSGGDGDDIGNVLTDLSAAHWRRDIAVVMQDASLFSGTILENILYGLGDEEQAALRDSACGGAALDERIVEAAKIAQLHDHVCRLPDGYDTEVGYRGSKLSGGQRQRVAIARAILRRPKLLLLDEATSALDTTTEKLLMTALLEWSRKECPEMTIVAIAHRLASIKASDEIFVLSNGIVAERGSHSELLEKEKGHYRSMWQLMYAAKKRMK